MIIRKRSLTAAAAALALLLAGCSSGSDPAETATSPAAPATSAAAAQVQEVKAVITTKGSKYAVDFPEEVAAGTVTVTLDNQSDVEQDLQIVSLADGHTYAEFQPSIELGGAPIPEWARAPGGVGSVLPGEQGSATFTLKEGKHTYFSTGEEQGDAYAKGANGEFTVTAAEGEPAPLPAADATIRMVGEDDAYGFEFDGLKAGDNSVLVDNQTVEPHHLVAFPIVGDATIEEVAQELTSGAQEPKTFDGTRSNSTAVVDGKQQMVSDLKLESGRYAMACFITDRKGGNPHLFEGTIQELAVS